MCEKGIVYDIVEGDVFRTVVSLDEKILQKEIALRFNINANTVKYYIRKMQKNGKIIREGTNRKGKWIIL